MLGGCSNTQRTDPPVESPSDGDTVDYAFSVDGLPTTSEFTQPPTLTVGSVEVTPFLVLGSMSPALNQPPTQLAWPSTSAVDAVQINSGFAPISVVYSSSETVDEFGIPSVEEQAFVECERGDDGKCAAESVNGAIVLRLPEQLDTSGGAYFIVQCEWDILGEGEPPTVETIMVSYAVHLTA